MISAAALQFLAATVLYTAGGASAAALVWFVVIPFIQFFAKVKPW